MATSLRSQPISCFLAIPADMLDTPGHLILQQAVRDAGLRVVAPVEGSPSAWSDRRFTESIALSDCILADVSTAAPSVFLELGLARALGKATFLVSQEKSKKSLSAFADVIFYQPTPVGYSALKRVLSTSLKTFAKYPRSSRLPLGSRVKSLFAVDWESIGGSDLDNLCVELLTQLGYKRIQWLGKSVEIDLMAELPKKDPDGFEYKEQWLISLGRNSPIEHVLELVNHDPDFFLHRVARHSERTAGTTRRDASEPITFLVISVDGTNRQRELFAEELRVPRRGTGGQAVRLRLWDRTYLTNLVYQFPPIGFKYFSDEGRSQSKFRKTPEQLYEENLNLSRRLVLERDMRVRAERDAVWKEISFSAAHKMGNPIFAIETNLDPLQKRIDENRLPEAVQVINDLRLSVEKAKTIVAQFRSLAVSRVSDRKVLQLKPILEAACNMIRSESIFCSVDCSDQLHVFGDAHELGECFDELASNALHWFDKAPKTVSISAGLAEADTLPNDLESGVAYAVVKVADNGQGVKNDDKLKIFNAFYTTYTHGTGLGLALTRRIVESHGGKIFEVGKFGVGAVFELYLPVNDVGTGSMAPMNAEAYEVEADA